MIPKFRVYDELLKEMYEVSSIEFDTGKIFYKAYGIDWYWNKDAILMQSTGLKDKNGVEIFEGDVVKNLVDNGFDYVDGFGVVRFQQGGFVIDYNNLDTEFEWLYYAQDEGEIEIIGSIYENPELLEGE